MACRLLLLGESRRKRFVAAEINIIKGRSIPAPARRSTFFHAHHMRRCPHPHAALPQRPPYQPNFHLNPRANFNFAWR